MPEAKALRSTTADEAIASEVAVLERAASGLRDALRAERAYAAVLEDDETLRVRAAAPVGTPRPRTLSVREMPGLAESLAAGVVAQIEDLPGSLGAGPALLIPWTSRGEVLGVGIAALGEHSVVPSDSVLALLGAKIGSALSALRDCGDLARQVAEMHDATIVLERLIRYSSDAIEMLDLDGRVLRWNGGCENLYGFTAEEVIGERLPHHPEEHRSAVVARFRATAASGRVDEYDAVARRQDGSLVGVSLVVIPVNDGDGNPAAVLAVACEAGGDTRFERTREDFLTVVSSQIKGPLTAILGYAQLLSRPEILADASRRSRTLAALEQHTAQMATVVDDLLLVSGTDDTTPVLDLEPLDLGLVVSETVKAFEQHNASHRFLIDFDTSIPALSGDRRRIERAVTSLLENAVAYSPIGSAVAVSVLLDGGEAIIEVTDTGVGIEPGDLEHVFERFYRGEGAENRQRPGVGIGLHLVKRIADAHGGSVSVESDPGHGSTFAIRLPASAPKRAVR